MWIHLHPLLERKIKVVQQSDLLIWKCQSGKQHMGKQKKIKLIKMMALIQLFVAPLAKIKSLFFKVQKTWILLKDYFLGLAWDFLACLSCWTLAHFASVLKVLQVCLVITCPTKITTSTELLDIAVWSSRAGNQKVQLPTYKALQSVRCWISVSHIVDEQIRETEFQDQKIRACCLLLLYIVLSVQMNINSRSYCRLFWEIRGFNSAYQVATQYSVLPYSWVLIFS